ncbi:hypothetical protein SAY87_005210 [Trapa incisa]|uniref:Uncharacterized protein n=1 Tax=Trapa incisa TaxID=236973 RepID=A0AAN7K617_9MYRT|nr:hypothetical protein SAY87_005210 [Trapa incisa]
MAWWMDGLWQEAPKQEAVMELGGNWQGKEARDPLSSGRGYLDRGGGGDGDSSSSRKKKSPAGGWEWDLKG